MKRYILRLAAISLLFPASSYALSPGFFAPKSRLANGNWVKIGVDNSGIYEISYAKLREMGFTDPSRVGVLGRGGRQMNLDFTDQNGTPLNPDDLSPVAVYHHDNKIFFYGQGTESLNFNANSTFHTKGIFQRASRNIYTDLGYYFLSDDDGVRVDMDVVELPPARTWIDSGLGYLYHERDLQHNSTNTGMLFWGECFNNGSPSRQEWAYDLPDAIEETDAMMECFFYIERGTSGTLKWGVQGSDKGYSSPVVNYNSTSFRAQEPNIHTTTIPQKSGFVYIDYDSPDNLKGTANLDYWTLTYRRRIPTLLDSAGQPVNQDFFAVTDVRKGQEYSIDLSATPEAVIFDISDPLFPSVMPAMEADNMTYTTFEGSPTVSKLIFSNLKLPQKGIKGYSSGWQDVANQNLHDFGKHGSSLLIITLPHLREQADRLAWLHRRHDGIRVVVATAEEIYNEFSAGVPDPMAYRLFAKMLYESPGEKLKNVLLIGPLYSDFRGMNINTDQTRGLIAFQNSTVTTDKGAQNVNDFIGMMDDYRSDQRLEKSKVQVGVGILPCSDPVELGNYIDKVEKYLNDDSFAYRLNKMLTIGGLYDRHTHDNQAVTLGKYLNSNNFNHLMYSTLSIDAYGSKEAGKRFRGYFNEGFNFVTYFGHGGPTLLGKNLEFFNKGDIAKLNNTTFPFMIFAGCELSNTDRGVRGLGEEMVLGHNSGLIGAILATRDTWSGENMDLVKIIYNRMFKDGNSITSPQLTQPLTIGEVYARAKNQSEYSNELAYQLVADPALVVPTALRTMKEEDSLKEIYAGKELTISGDITDFKGNDDKDFNGLLVARLAYPEVKRISQDLETNSIEDGDTLTISYIDRQAFACAADVKDGKFQLKINVPRSMASYSGEKAFIYLSAYDKKRRIGSAATLMPVIKTPVSSEIQKPDETSPVIEMLEFDPESLSLEVTVSDNSGLDTSSEGHPSSFILYLDGKTSRLGWEEMTRLIPGRQAFSKSIPVGWMADGIHSARLEVKDLDGNVATREITFRLGANPNLALACSDRAARDKAEFSIEGSASGKLSLIITNDEGEAVATLDVAGREAIWDLRDEKGARVAPGLYKAVVRADSSGEYSETVDIAVVGAGRQ